MCQSLGELLAGRVLAAKDIWGHVSADLVCYENANYGDRKAMDPGETAGDFTAPLKSPEPPGTPHLHYG